MQENFNRGQKNNFCKQKLFFCFIQSGNEKDSPLDCPFHFSQVWIGVEPTNDGFADRSLTAWVPHQNVRVI